MISQKGSKIISLLLILPFSLSENTCSFEIDHCKKCEKSKCIKCEKGFTLIENKCKKEIPELFFYVLYLLLY